MAYLTPMTLTFDPVTPKSRGFDVWTKFEEGQGVLELLTRNEKVTEWPTDQPTCAKQYALFFEGGT